MRVVPARPIVRAFPPNSVIHNCRPPGCKGLHFTTEREAVKAGYKTPWTCQPCVVARQRGFTCACGKQWSPNKRYLGGYDLVVPKES